MSTIPDLDDPNQSVIYIMYRGPDHDEDDSQEYIQSPPYKPFEERDLPNGYALRLKVYRAAWTKCLDRVQAIIRDLHEPVIDAVVRHVHNAYSSILPALPYSEMPVVSITAGGPLLHEITIRLDPDIDASETSTVDSSHPEAFVTHIFPADRPNIMTCMKTMISGFVDRSPDGLEDQPKRKVSTSLAAYDIELLEAWFDVVREAHDSQAPPQLVVLLHEFEQFDPAVIQDLFYICSLHVPRLPLIFVIAMSSSPALSPSYLHLTYPRSTLALLNVHNFTVPSGPEVLYKILYKTMFDVDFEPDVILGPTFIEYVSDFFTRHNSSLDALISTLHLAHLKHFDDPLTIFTQDSHLGHPSAEQAAQTLLMPSSFPFLDHLLTRLHAPAPNVPPSPDHASEWMNQNPATVLASIDEARINFRAKMSKTRVALGLMKRVNDFMFNNGWKGIVERNDVEWLCEALKGRLGRDGKYLGTMVKKLPAAKLHLLLEDLHSFFHNLPSYIRTEENLTRATIVRSLATFTKESDAARSDAMVKLAGDTAEWLTTYFQTNLTSMEDCKLWDIWYTASTHFPSELINPSVRASIISGLLRPLDYVETSNPQSEPPELWELPDTSILFRRYLDSGKMINVYDWFESFAAVLDSQRKRTKQREKTSKMSTPRKGKGKGKGKQKQVEIDSDEEDNEEEEEKWKMEVQARFMRSLHELDYLGFIKHTGRKADHVLRTVFDIAD